jgi:hypothetical protein
VVVVGGSVVVGVVAGGSVVVGVVTGGGEVVVVVAGGSVVVVVVMVVVVVVGGAAISTVNALGYEAVLYANHMSPSATSRTTTFTAKDRPCGTLCST